MAHDRRDTPTWGDTTFGVPLPSWHHLRHLYRPNLIPLPRGPQLDECRDIASKERRGGGDNVLHLFANTGRVNSLYDASRKLSISWQTRQAGLSEKQDSL